MRFLTANTLFNGTEKLPGDLVLVLDDDNRLKEIAPKARVEKSNIEHLDGILTPGFVNAHCHLELSHLRDQIPQHTGLPGFAKQVITQRNKFSPEEITERMQGADKAMQQNGIVAVGDISNSDESFAVKAQSSVFYHTFIELIGLNPASQAPIFDKGIGLLQRLQEMKLKGSLAPHAPYSTSVELIEKIAAYNAKLNLPFTIHNQESNDELKFFKGEANGFDELYKFLGLDLSWFKAPGKSSLQAYVNYLSPATPSVLVHNTFTSKPDLEAAHLKNIFWCFCPGANLYIENRLPDLMLFAGKEDRLCIGTDSLASNSQLDVLAEINLVSDHTAQFTEEALLRAITSNGAAALGIAEHFGSFIIGKNTGLNLVASKNSKLQFLKKIA